VEKKPDEGSPERSPGRGIQFRFDKIDYVTGGREQVNSHGSLKKYNVHREWAPEGVI